MDRRRKGTASEEPGEAVDDERYLVVDGRRWRRADPAIPDALRKELVAELMAARRAVGVAKRAGEGEAERSARARVNDAKVALGERGRAWWLAREGGAMEERLTCAMRALLRKRGPAKTICPSDAARVAGGEEWRDWMDSARSVARRLVDDGWAELTQGGKVVEPPVKGPVRVRRRES